MQPLTTPEHALRCQGCHLRVWAEADAPRLVQAWGVADIAEFNAVPAEPTTATATGWIAGQQARLERRLSVDLAIVDDTDVVVGEVGLSSFNDTHRGAMIGYWLLPEARNHGLATVAVRAVTDWAFPALELAVIVARCDPSNVASQQVAARSDFVHEANDSTGHQLWRLLGPGR